MNDQSRPDTDERELEFLPIHLLPAGTIIYVDGLPLYLTEETKVAGYLREEVRPREFGTDADSVDSGLAGS